MSRRRDRLALPVALTFGSLPLVILAILIILKGHLT